MAKPNRGGKRAFSGVSVVQQPINERYRNFLKFASNKSAGELKVGEFLYPKTVDTEGNRKNLQMNLFKKDQAFGMSIVRNKAKITKVEKRGKTVKITAEGKNDYGNPLKYVKTFKNSELISVSK